MSHFTAVDLITVTRVESPDQVEILRQLRNATRGTYSNSNQEISTNEQQVWWERHHETLMAWYLSVDDEPAGFAVLTILPEATPRVGLPRKLEGCATTTAGVLPKFRGKGLGYMLMGLLEDATGCPLVACARLDNPGGMKCHRASSNWRETHRDAVNAYYRREGLG